MNFDVRCEYERYNAIYKIHSHLGDGGGGDCKNMMACYILMDKKMNRCDKVKAKAKAKTNKF